MVVRRLFLAIAIPTELKEEIGKAIPILQHFTSGSARFVAKENLHITLAFLGSRPSKDIKRTTQLTKEATRLAPFELATTAFGCFPGARKARVLWLGVTSCEAMEHLYQTLCTVLSPVGFQPQKAGIQPGPHPFQPHITVARNKRPAPVHVEGINSHLRIVKPIPVEKITLFASELHQEGARYTVVEDFYLSV